MLWVVLALLLASPGAVQLSNTSVVATHTGSTSAPVVAPAAADLVFTGTLQGPQNQASEAIATTPNGTVWNVVSAQVWVNDSQAASSWMNSYIYTWINPAITSWQPNMDTLANVVANQGSEGSYSGAGGYSTTGGPPGLTQYIQWDQTIQLSYAVQAVFAAQLPAGATASYVMVVAPESGTFTTSVPFNVNPGVTLVNGTSPTIVKIPDSTPSAGDYYRVENAWATQWLNTPESPPMLAEIVEEPSGFVLCSVATWPDDGGTGLQVFANGGYSTKQTATDEGAGQYGTATVWTNNVTVSSNQWLQAEFIGDSGDAGLYALTLTEYPSSGPAYTATFDESGLAAGTDWSVTMSGTRQSSVTNSIVFTAGEGTYNYSIEPLTGYTASPASGSLLVQGNTTEDITFSSTQTVHVYSVTFNESGLPEGTLWSVTLGDDLLDSRTNYASFNETNGSYAYTIGAPVDFTATPGSGSVTLSGSALERDVSFTENGTTGGGGGHNNSTGPSSPTTPGTIPPSGTTTLNGYLIVADVVAEICLVGLVAYFIARLGSESRSITRSLTRAGVQRPR